MLIRVASEADVSGMHRIRMSVRENRLTDPSLVQPDDYRSMLDERGRGWVAEIDGRVVGFAVADLARSNVWALFVDPGCEGRGIGRRLHDVMLDWMFAAGAGQVWLGTDPGTRAERFYQSAGWRYAGSEPNGEARYEMLREQWLVRSASASAFLFPEQLPRFLEQLQRSFNCHERNSMEDEKGKRQDDANIVVLYTCPHKCAKRSQSNYRK